MQLINNLFLALVATGAVRAATNEPCIGSGGDPGVCVTTSTCSSSGGIAISGACPSDPADVKCCSKPSCGTAANSTCLWQSDCAGTSITNQCPGPSQFKCCQSAADGWGGYSAPSIPSVGACKQVAIDGAKKIVAHFPGRVKTVYCTRDCGCGSGSDHCCGKATDMMCSDNGGHATNSGKEIAEWVMDNRATLDLKYVIWGQRIWETGIHDVKPWSEWKPMEDRGDITANHWDHVHVSYN